MFLCVVQMFPVCLHVNVIKGMCTTSTTVPPLKLNIPVKEEKTLESFKAPAMEKPFLSDKAKVMRCYDPDLTVRGLHKRGDQEIKTLGREEEKETREKTEGGGWTTTSKPQQEKDPEMRKIDENKINKVTETQQKVTVKLEASENSQKPEVIQKIKFTKLQTKNKESEEEVEPVFTATQETGDIGRARREKVESEVEKDKIPKEEPESNVSKKKIMLLPKNEEEQEVVTLKPFKNPDKPGRAESPKAEKIEEGGRESKAISFMRSKNLLRDEPPTAIRHAEDGDSSLTTSPKVILGVEQCASPERTEVHNETVAANKLPKRIDFCFTLDEKKEQILLKPFTKISKSEEKLEPHQTPKDKTQRELKKPQRGQAEENSKCKEEKKEDPSGPSEIPSPSGKKYTEIPPKHKQKHTLSPRVSKNRQSEEEKLLNPQRVQFKETPSSKVLERSSVENVQQVPKTASPKDLIEARSLKELLKKPSAEEASESVKPSRDCFPLVRDVPPGAVQMEKMPTQQEEEIFEVKFKVLDTSEEEEAWGWELVSSEDCGNEGVDGAFETPAPPDSKQGEVKVASYDDPGAPCSTSDESSSLPHI